MKLEVTEGMKQASSRQTRSEMRSDLSDPKSWEGRALRYSVHARERCDERDIPQIIYLPADSRLADVDMDDRGVVAVTFKVLRGDDSFFVVLSADGLVVTAHWGGPRYAAAQHFKQRRRGLLATAA